MSTSFVPWRQSVVPITHTIETDMTAIPRPEMIRREPLLKSRLCAVICLTLLFMAGCDRGPVAPELRDSPVYQNHLEGFRFLVPDNWTQSASANLPLGDLDTELFLVRYGIRSPEPNAQVQVLCLQDTSGQLDFLQHHLKPAFGIDNWKSQQEPRTETIGGQLGTWLYLTGRNKTQEMAKEVLCFRKGDRIYSFIGTFQPQDEKARQTIQRAFESIIWEE